ncbi:hypothetical protein SFUMM280S_09604 [Streptomyces fumanus]
MEPITDLDGLRRAMAENSGQPEGPARNARAEQLLAEAERLNVPLAVIEALGHQLKVYNYSSEKAKMFVPFARLLRMWDERPEDFDEYETHSLHWVFKWVSAGMLDQPHVPLASVEKWIGEMEHRYRVAGYSERAVRAAEFGVASHVGDIARAERAYTAWLAADRDAMADCHACELHAQGCWQAERGRDEEALALWRPVLDGEFTCAHEPHAALASSLVPLLRLGRAEEARAHHLRGIRLVRSMESMRGAYADHVEFCALSGNEARGLELLAERPAYFTDDGHPRSRLDFLCVVALLMDRLTARGLADRPVPGPPAAPGPPGNSPGTRAGRPSRWPPASTSATGRRTSATGPARAAARQLAAADLARHWPEQHDHATLAHLAATSLDQAAWPRRRSGPSPARRPVALRRRCARPGRALRARAWLAPRTGAGPERARELMAAAVEECEAALGTAADRVRARISAELGHSHQQFAELLARLPDGHAAPAEALSEAERASAAFAGAGPDAVADRAGAELTAGRLAAGLGGRTGRRHTRVPYSRSTRTRRARTARTRRRHTTARRPGACCGPAGEGTREPSETSSYSTPMSSTEPCRPPRYTTVSTARYASRTRVSRRSATSSGASSPRTRVTSSPPAASIRSRTVTAVPVTSEPITATSPSTRPRTSPAWQTPAEVHASRSATVTSAYRVAPAAEVIATTSSSKRRPGSWTASAAMPWTAERVGIRATRTPEARACSAAAAAVWRSSASFGSNTTSRAWARRTASASSPLAGGSPGARARRSRRPPCRARPGPRRARRPRRPVRPARGAAARRRCARHRGRSG